MTLHLFHLDAGEEVHTLATWQRGDSLKDWMWKYALLLERRDDGRFMPERAEVRTAAGRLSDVWP